MVMPNKQGKGSVQVCDGTQTLVSCIKATLSASRLTPTSTPSALDVCIAHELIRFLVRCISLVVLLLYTSTLKKSNNPVLLLEEQQNKNKRVQRPNDGLWPW